MPRLVKMSRGGTREQREELVSVLIEKAGRKAYNDFATFVRMFWVIVDPSPLEWSWHMEAVCDALQEVELGRCRRLVINVPPGFSKSLLTCVFFPAWQWLRNPTRRTLFLSHDKDVAIRDSRRMRILIESPEYRALLTRFHGKEAWTLSDDQNAKSNFENSKKGFRYCGAIGGKITGKRGDGIIIDDPHDVKEAIEGSPERIAERMAETCNIFKQVLKSRLNDQRKGYVIIIMQRVHEGDLAGMAIAQKYKTVILPMRFDPARADPRDPRKVAGELLDPVRFPLEIVEEMEADLGSQASGQLNQEPVSPSGSMFPVGIWLWQDRRAFPVVYQRRAAAWDMAFGASEDSAFTSGVEGGLSNGKVYLLSEEYGRWESPEMIGGMKRMHQKGVVGQYVEDRASARAVTDILKREIPGLVLVQPITDKVTRAQAWKPYVQAGNIILPCTCGNMIPHHHELEGALPGEPFAAALVAEAAVFPKGKLKDRVDAAGYLFIELLGKPSSTPQDIRARYGVTVKR